MLKRNGLGPQLVFTCAKELQHKILAYRSATKTQQTIFSTFVTTFGVKENECSEQCIDVEIKLGELF